MKKEDYNLIAERFNNFSRSKQKAFILILIERQFSVYKKMCIGKEWNREKSIIDILENCWKSIINESEIDPDLLDLCMESNPENLEYDEEDEEKISFLVTIIDNLTAYVRLIVAKEEFDGVFTRCNYDYLENFLYQYYDWKPLSTNLVSSHELVFLEYSRSIRDLEYLETTNDLLEVYLEYRNKKESILEDYWFNENF
ncbi:MAG TPA: DUF416 family protein [Bacillota bacterium]|nr:DUF416 family protein [Bacillota bacterium]HPO97984.1 DUF416 family protein [Bacillota bacterium]